MTDEVLTNEEADILTRAAEKLARERPCCFIDCGKPAEWNLHGSNAVYESVDSCTNHVGHLLDDAPETRVTFIGNSGR